MRPGRSASIHCGGVASRSMNQAGQTVDGRPTWISENLPLDRRQRVGHNGRQTEPPGALYARPRSPAGASGGPSSTTAGVVRGPATMVAADSDNVRGLIAALQCSVAAYPANAAATCGPLWLRERATHRAATRRRSV